MFISKAEDLVASVLDTLNINYLREVEFEGLVGESGAFLPTDFAVDFEGRLVIIEVNGPHHYKPLSNNIKDVEQFRCTVKKDSKRLNFAKKNRIPLLRIHHANFNSIEAIIFKAIQTIKESKVGKIRVASKSFMYVEYGVGAQYKVYLGKMKRDGVFFDVDAFNGDNHMKLSYHKDGYLEIGNENIIMPKAYYLGFVDKIRELEAKIETLETSNRALVEDLRVYAEHSFSVDEDISCDNGEISTFQGKSFRDGRMISKSARQYIRHVYATLKDKKETRLFLQKKYNESISQATINRIIAEDIAV